MIKAAPLSRVRAAICSSGDLFVRRRPDVVGSDVVFALDVLERHAASQATDNYRHRHAGTPNNGLAVTDGRVNNNAVRSGLGELDDSELAGLVEFGLPQR